MPRNSTCLVDQMNIRDFMCLVLLVGGSTGFAADSESTGAEPPTSGVEFQLPGVDAEVVLKKATTDFTVVCFLGTECPLARLYGPRLERLSKKYPDRVRVIGVNSNRQDSMDDLKSYAASLKLTFALAKDYKNVVADRFHAKRTPEVYLLDRDLKIVYRGRIDDQYQPGVTRKQPTTSDLQIALEEVLAGQPVTQSTTQPTGCLIGRTRSPVTDSKVTYTKHVAAVLAKHCIECHRPQEIGPFSLTEYDEVAGWAEMMVEVIDEKRMPPWHANPDHGDFTNARAMPAADQQVIRDWVSAGAPFGDPADLPEPTEYLAGWQLPKEPDQVVSMREGTYWVPAEGTVEYQYFVVDPGFKEDKWVSAAQIIPGDRGVVHHAIAFIRPPDGQWFRGIGWMTAYVPGQRLSGFKGGYARRVPAKSKIVFQMHYTTNGEAAADNSKLGLVFADEKDVTHEVFTLVAIDQDFEIPPHATDHPVTAAIRPLPNRGQLLALAPHMHVRGKSFHVTANVDGKKQVLLDVPQYDFNWQHSYELRHPLDLATVKSIEFVAKFDNSDQNPVNPDPAQHVTWGDQTSEEMAIAFFEVAEPRKPSPADDDTTVASQKNARHDKSVPQPPTQREIDAGKKAATFVIGFMKRFDVNEDGLVVRDELPRGVSRRGWWQIDADTDGDGKWSADEVREAARVRYLNK